MNLATGHIAEHTVSLQEMTKIDKNYSLNVKREHFNISQDFHLQPSNELQSVHNFSCRL